MKSPVNKKIMVFSVCILLICSVTAVFSFGEETVGDVNRDGSIDEEDCNFILGLDAGLTVCSDSEMSAIAAEGDVNGDGVIDAGDAILIKRYCAGFIDSYDETEPEETETTTSTTTEKVTSSGTTKKTEIGTEDNTNRDIIIDLR